MATLAAAAGSLLALYGAVLTTGGILVLTGVIHSTAATNTHALRWHAVLWDPWYLAWGLALAIAGIALRRTTPAGSGRRRRPRRLTTAP
jgi:hypothetical protein